jgi:hypothetical protein
MKTQQERIREMKPRQIQSRLDELLAGDWKAVQLRDKLEVLAEARAFGGLTWFWGPELYRRDRVVFRPFILSHFATHLVQDWKWKQIEWRGEKGDRLDTWFHEVDANGDAELFKRLYAWKHQKGNWEGIDGKQWQADLIEHFQHARSAAKRQSVLNMFGQRAALNQRAARELYRIDHQAAASFILRHLHQDWEEKRKLWRPLFQEARDRGDDEFAFALYRKQISDKDWETDILALAKNEADQQTLCDDLERRHPEGHDLNLSMPICRLVEIRGRDVLPYVQRHLRGVYRSWYGGRDGYTKLVKLAAANQWWDLWSGLVRTCANRDEYDKQVRQLLEDRETSDADIQRRLLQLTGISREWDLGPFSMARVQQLEDETAIRLYGRFPGMLRGPFRMHVSAGLMGNYEKLIEHVIRAEDETLIDFLASRLVTRFVSPYGWGQDQVEVANRLSRYYESFRDDELEFSRRALQVLGQVPAYSFWNFRDVVRTNRLARMFYARAPEKYLACGSDLRNLLESPEIHAQSLGFRVLGLDRDDARRLAVQNLDLLQATLLRPLHRSTRLLAFQALQNAANDVQHADHIAQRCRQALDLPDRRYPKEQLVGLLGRLLHRWPELRSEREQPVVYGAQ